MKCKYTRPLPELRVFGNGHKNVVGVRDGRRSAAESRELLVRPQAQVIITKFGGARELARTLKECSDDPADHYDPSTIYRWMYPRSRGGSGGEIPTAALKSILRCARLAGVMLTSADIYPNMLPDVDFAEK